MGTSAKVLSRGFFRSMPGRTFKSKRAVSNDGDYRRRRRCRRSRRGGRRRSCLRVIENLIKSIESHSITYSRSLPTLLPLPLPFLSFVFSVSTLPRA